MGIVEAYVIPVEAQGALTSTLHAHMLIWLKKYPKTSVEEEEDKEYNTNVCQYVDKHLIGSYPILDLFMDADKTGMMKCPLCVDGYISSNPIPFICQTSLVSFEPVVGKCCECKNGFTSKRLRDSCREVLLRTLYVNGYETSKQQLYTEVKNIISSECIFPFPDILPKNLPRNRRDEYMKYITKAIKNEGSISDCFISDDDAEFLLVVLRLDIGIELTHAHKFKVCSSCILKCLFYVIFFLFSTIEVASKKDL